MRRLKRRCRDDLIERTWLVFMVVLHLEVLVRFYFGATFLNLGVPNIDYSFAVQNLWLVGTLAIAYPIWFWLVQRRLLAPETGYGLVLAAFGVVGRGVAELAVYGFNWIYPLPRAVFFGSVTFEALPDPGSHFLVMALRHFGTLAFILGLLLVPTAWWIDRRPKPA